MYGGYAWCESVVSVCVSLHGGVRVCVRVCMCVHRSCKETQSKKQTRTWKIHQLKTVL